MTASVLLCSPALAADLGEIADKALQNEKNAARTMQIPSERPAPAPEVEEAIRRMEIFLNNKQAEDPAKLTERIELFKGLNKQTSAPPQTSNLKGRRIYVFISGSMPQELLREYAVTLDHGGDPLATGMVMRGFVAGSGLKGKPTLEFIHRILETSDGGNLNVSVTIDPPLFTKLGIKHVPAIAFVPSIREHDSFESDTLSQMSNGFYVYYGDVALDYALEQINKHVHDGELEKYISKLRKGFYR